MKMMDRIAKQEYSIISELNPIKAKPMIWEQS